MLFTIIILTVVYAKNVQEFIVRMCEQNRTFILTRVKRMCILSTLHFWMFFFHLLLLPRALMLCQCVEYIFPLYSKWTCDLNATMVHISLEWVEAISTWGHTVVWCSSHRWRSKPRRFLFLLSCESVVEADEIYNLEKKLNSRLIWSRLQGLFWYFPELIYHITL